MDESGCWLMVHEERAANSFIWLQESVWRNGSGLGRVNCRVGRHIVDEQLVYILQHLVMDIVVSLVSFPSSMKR